ncbi:MAG: hypothetical protein ACR2PL_12835 [Dehalococcoidia bacterium]
MTELERVAIVRRAAERAAGSGFFLSSALVAYQDEHELDDVALSDWLGLTVDQLPRLRLCRRPDQHSAKFGAEVRQIAAFTGAQPLRLATLLREVDAGAALGRTGESSTVFLAARDADDDKGTEDRQ